jgi:hypothetical protein
LPDRRERLLQEIGEMGRAILWGLTLCLLSGCAEQAAKETAKLSQACQITKCDCASNFMTLFDHQPVTWKPDGTASCPEGYHLRRIQPAPQSPG